MRSYVVTPLARADIFAIWTHIAQDSEEAADRVEQAIYDACSFLAEAPLQRPSPTRSHHVPAPFRDTHPLS